MNRIFRSAKAVKKREKKGNQDMKAGKINKKQNCKYFQLLRSTASTQTHTQMCNRLSWWVIKKRTDREIKEREATVGTIDWFLMFLFGLVLTKILSKNLLLICFDWHALNVTVNSILLVYFHALLYCGTLFRFHVSLSPTIIKNLIAVFCLPETCSFIVLTHVFSLSFTLSIDCALVTSSPCLRVKSIKKGNLLSLDLQEQL